MPEGPEVTVHAERLHAACSGQVLRRADILSGRYLGDGPTAGRGSPPQRWNELQHALPATVDSVQSKGKFMFMRMTPCQGAAPLTLWSTLGMTGAWSLTPTEHARVVLELSEPSAAEPLSSFSLFYNDQRNFGSLTVCVDEVELKAKLASLGPSWLEPKGLSLEAFLAIAAKQCRTKRGAAVPLAKFLMDQSKTAGIGNYILSETLYLARVNPWAACGDLDREAWAAVHAAASDVIGRSYASQAALAEAQAARAAQVAQTGVSLATGAAELSTYSGGRRSLSATRGTTYTFRLHVYRRSVTDEGLVVRKEEGPHKRSVFWVPERQIRGRREGQVERY